MAFMVGKAGVFKAEWQAPPKAIVKYTFIVPDLRRRDPDNLIASCKAILDGLVDAGVIRDDSGKQMVFDQPEIKYIKGKRAIIISIGEFMGTT
uniref:Uncharacterized protein n=1 Tax=viral metagenome TaxID=1070528 RepID=A0A6M3JTT8_9ZZZZ